MILPPLFPLSYFKNCRQKKYIVTNDAPFTLIRWEITTVLGSLAWSWEEVHIYLFFLYHNGPADQLTDSNLLVTRTQSFGTLRMFVWLGCSRGLRCSWPLLRELNANCGSLEGTQFSSLPEGALWLPRQGLPSLWEQIAALWLGSRWSSWLALRSLWDKIKRYVYVEVL